MSAARGRHVLIGLVAAAAVVRVFHMPSPETGEDSVLRWDHAVIRKYEGLRGALWRLADLRTGGCSARIRPATDTFDTWRSTRLPGEWL